MPKCCCKLNSYSILCTIGLLRMQQSAFYTFYLYSHHLLKSHRNRNRKHSIYILSLTWNATPTQSCILPQQHLLHSTRCYFVLLFTWEHLWITASSTKDSVNIYYNRARFQIKCLLKCTSLLDFKAFPKFFTTLQMQICLLRRKKLSWIIFLKHQSHV